mmetsp:Transcript_11778/g.22332  ORF Transcript_11778/g.22332 Transcript_11778/m.22332 type:complete len:86 (-) Transcript_11778:745-1002(-)
MPNESLRLHTTPALGNFPPGTFIAIGNFPNIHVQPHQPQTKQMRPEPNPLSNGTKNQGPHHQHYITRHSLVAVGPHFSRSFPAPA